MNRPIVYFEHSLVSASRDLSRRIVGVLGRKAEYASVVAFLLVPNTENNDSLLFVSADRAMTKPLSDSTTRKAWLLKQLTSETRDKSWQQFATVRNGRFFGLGAVGPVLTILLESDTFCYSTGNKKIHRISPVRRVYQVPSGREIKSDVWEELEEWFHSLHPVSNGSATPNVLPKTEKREFHVVPTRLDWEVLPPGWWQRPVVHAKPKRRSALLSSGELERIVALNKLSPKAWYVGSHLGEELYYVAVFNNVVVADSPTIGNALYYLFCRGEEWKGVFRKSKADALEAGAKRLVHSGEWRDRLKEIVSIRLAAV